MSIIIDKRKTDIRYVDKANLQYANNDKVAKLIAINKSSFYDKLIAIISAGVNLSESETKAFYIIGKHNKEKTNVISKIYCTLYNKSTSTFNRALNVLLKKKIVYVNKENKIVLFPDFDVTIYNKEIDYIIIEVNTEVTSKPCSL